MMSFHDRPTPNTVNTSVSSAMITLSTSSNAMARPIQISHWSLVIWVKPSQPSRTGMMVINSEIP